MPENAPKSEAPKSLPEPLGNLSRRLQQLRTARGWTQKLLASRSRIRPDRLSRLENGHNIPSIEESVRLASAFGISLDDLVFGSRSSSRRSSSHLILARDLGTVTDLAEPKELLAISQTLELFARLLRQCRAPRKAP